jgi:RNA polymerase sigma-70 factor (ECF subfamily)
MHALDQLPFEFRMTILLADMHDLSYKEIAEVLDCPVGTVMSRLHRARKLLQAQLFAYAVERGIIKAPDGLDGENVADLDSFRRRRKVKPA